MSNDLVNQHRQMMLLSGNLSDFQLQNLKNYPYVFFDGVEKVEINYNFGDDGVVTPGEIFYKIKLKKRAKKKSLKKNEDELIACVKFLFWKETKVYIDYER